MRAAIASFRTATSVSNHISRVLLAVIFLLAASLSLSAQIAVSPATLSFSKTVIGITSASKAVTITNNGPNAQAVNIVMSGDFSETDNCGGNIGGGGGSCTMHVSFTPTISGSISGAASIYDPSKNLLAFVGLTGSGTAPVAAAPSSLSFGSVPIGTLSAAKNFKITNSNPTTVTVTSIVASSDYVLNTGTCLTTPLNHGQSCTVSVQVQPTEATANGVVVITDNASNGTPLVVALKTTGTGSSNAPISLSKTSLTFKAAAGGNSATQTITVTNTSGSPVTMGTIAASSDYSQTNTCPAPGSPLGVGGTCNVTITFSPQFAAKIGGSASIGYTGSNSPQFVNLSGTASTPLSVSPSKLAFPLTPVGATSAAKPFKITNNSASAITLNSLVPSADFQIQLQGTTCSLTGGSLGAGKNCTVQVQLAPTIAGTIVGSMTVTNSGSPNPLLEALSGSGSISATATLNPSSAHQGSAETIVITGTNTHFGPTTTVNFGADITTGTLTVNGPTSASVPITIDNVATVGARNVTITTGAEVVTASFTVVAGVPTITLINPNTIQPTQTENVAVTGVFTAWVNGTTKANFGPGISVGGAPAGTFGPVTVNGAASLTASLKTSGASNGFRTVQIQTNSQTLTVVNGMFVETCSPTAPTVLLISPLNAATNVPLNAQVQVQFSVPMNRNTFSLGNSGSSTIFFYDSVTSQEVPGTITVDASGTVATISPSVVLAAGRTHYVYLSYANSVQDACGNNLSPVQYYFTTAYNTNITGPTLTGTSPVNSDTNIPLNAPVVLQFDTQLDPITAQAGFSMTTGGNAVAGNFTYAANDKTVTFTPVNPLTASTSYTASYSAQITDTVGNPLTNPGSVSFTTGTSSDTTAPQVALVDPPTNSFGVGLNVTPRITFTEPVNELTIPSALALYYENGFVIPSGTVTVSPDRMSATITPAAPLLSGTEYGVYICGYTDIAGNNGGCFNSVFFTGTGSDTGHATVTTISPANGQTGVPLNTVVAAVMSDDIDPTSLTNSSITVTPQGGSAVAGTVALANDGVTLTFTPSSTLAPSKLHNVSVGGFKDIEGNTVTAFSSSFTTGTVGYASGSFAINSTNPANGATNVPVNSPVSFTMTNLINGASVNPNTVFVYVNATSQVVAGTYGVSGNTVTFTPLSPYPGNTVMGFGVYGLTDEAGNPDYQYGYTFTTANTIDNTAPTVTISPSNGTTNVGINTQIVLTFSKSINPSTITVNSLALFSGDTPVSYGYSISRDNRTVVLNPGGSAWTSGATITIELTNGIQDLSGNALANTNSQFTLTTALSGAAPSVVAMRPGNGATNVAANTLITLFTSAPMNPSTITGALHVTDGGVVVSGAVQLFSSGQAIEFTPANSFTPGHIIQVFLDSTAQGANGVPLSAFSGQFTTAGSPTNTAAIVQAVNPFPNATSVPTNTILQVEYNQQLQGSSITCDLSGASSVVLYDNTAGVFQNPTCTLVGNGQVIQIAPTSNLTASHQYFVYVDYGANVTNTNGVTVQAYQFFLTAGSGPDNAAPTITSEAPTNNATNIGTNALVSVNFNKAINPVSVTGSTIQLSGGSQTEVPSSISFSPDYTRVSIVPQAPLPPSTVMTMAVNGVTSQAGKSVATTTTTFTTAGQPDFTQAYVLNSSVQNGQVNVPVNSVFSMQFSKAMDLGSYNAANVNIYGGPYPSGAPATVTWSADQTTVFIVPTSPLFVGTSYCLESFYMTDLSGNPQQNFNICFTAAFNANTNPPTVVNTSPENTEAQVPNNAPVQILFSEPIQPTSIGQITLKTGGNPVAVDTSFSDANQLLTLTPTTPLLAANATFTLTITGVKDTAGNQMVGTVTNTFTTGATFNLIHPQVVLSDPAPSTTGVGTNVNPRITFSERLNPLSVVTSSNETYNGNGSVEMYNNATGQWIPLTVSMSSDRMTAIITPNSPLLPNTQYVLYIGASKNYFDVAGNYGYGYTSVFTTGASSDTSATTVSSITPTNAQTSVPINTVVTAVMSDDIDPTTVSNSSITVKQAGNGVAGTVALASDGVTLTFTPSAPLPAQALLYNVSVGGFKDTEGNSVTAFNSTFTTGTSGYAGGSFVVNGTNPVSGATGVSVTSPVTITMSNLINPASVNPNTVFVFVQSNNDVMAGSYSVSGNQVTFTPLTQYPANTPMQFGVYGLTDEAGNLDYQYSFTFTTANTVDHTAPTVTITPSNGSSNLGLNTQAVLTFSKSINPATISSGTVNMLNGDVPLNPGITISRDNRTVVLNPGTLPAGATITVTASHLITDLSANALADTSSQFTTTAAVLTQAPYVINARPGSGATNVPTSSVITLFTTAPMNAGTLSGALYVTQNGALVTGTTTVGSNGQSIEFTPSSALAAGVPTQVFLNSTAQDIYGNYLSAFSETFTTAGSPTNTAAVVQAVNPFPNATNVPTNTVLQVEYNQQLQGSSITCNLGGASSVVLYDNTAGAFQNPTCTLVGNGQVIQIAPTGNLTATHQYFVYVDYGANVTNTNGVAVQAYQFFLTAGSGPDNAAPTILSLAPADTSTNIGTNAGVSVNFNKAINPVSVTSSSIQVSGGSFTDVASSIAFSPDYTRATIIPQAPLPSSTSMTLAISGVTSEAGVAVANKTTHFTTMAEPDFSQPFVVNTSVQSSQTVGTNAAFAMQFNKAMDPGTVNPAGNQYVYVYDNNLGTYAPVTITFSADLTTVMLKPTANLAASHSFQLCSYYMADLSGNPQQNFCVGFNTGSGTDTTGPAVAQVSPPSGFNGVGTNAWVQVLFNEFIDAASIGGVILKQGSSVIPTTATLFDGDQGVQLRPLTPLAPNTTYTINVSGVLDITGNAQTSFPSQSFTTGTGVDLVQPTFVSSNPVSGAVNVPVNTTVQVVFSKAMDPAAFDPATSFTLRDPSNNVVPATITFTAGYTTATLQPKSNLAANTLYYLYMGYAYGNLWDMSGNAFSGTYINFTTHP